MTINEIKQKLSNFHVGLAGCGGLGSNCAMALARSGVGKLTIVDFDIIDMSNLNRQYYFHAQLGKKKVLALKDNIEKVDPKIQVIPYAVKIEPKHVEMLFKDCDIIVEAFDKREAKEMLIETCLERFPEKPLIIGSGMAGWGDNNSIKTTGNGNLYVCGDQKREIASDLPPIAPRVGIVAMMQANLVLELLLGKIEN